MYKKNRSKMIIFTVMFAMSFLLVSRTVYATDINGADKPGLIESAVNMGKSAVRKASGFFSGLTANYLTHTGKAAVDLVGEPVIEGVVDAIDEKIFDGDENNEYPKMMLKMMAQPNSTGIKLVAERIPVYSTLVWDGERPKLIDEVDALNKSYQIFCIIASFWCIAVAMGNYFKNIQQGKDPLDSILQIILEIGIVGILIINMPSILSVIVGLGKEIFTATGGVLGAGEAAELDDEACEEILEIMTGARTGHFFWNCQAIIQLILPFTVSFVTQVVAVVMYIGLCFEIFLTRFFVPFAITDIYQEGLRSPGFRYLKKYFGRYVRLSCIFVILQISNYLFCKNMSSFFEGGSTLKVMTNIAAVVALQVAVILTMSKTGEIINDSLGV